MKPIFLLFVLLVLSACWKTPLPQSKEPQMKSAIQTFKTLRAESSYFEGGEYNPRVDPFESEMHRAMLAIEKKLKDKNITTSQIKSLLGEPDAEKDREGNSRLIYFWRGWHDYLFFEFDGEQITAVNWFFAGE